MMQQTKIIELNQYRKPSFDYEGYNRRAVRRYRRAAVCQIVTAVLDSLCAVTLAACLIIGTAALIAMG